METRILGQPQIEGWIDKTEVDTSRNIYMDYVSTVQKNKCCCFRET